MKKGNHVYKFTWIDEDGEYAGWNDCQASSMKQARAIGKTMESPARDFEYGIIKPDGTRGVSIGRNKGLYIDPKSFKRISVEAHFEMHRIADMMAR